MRELFLAVQIALVAMPTSHAATDERERALSIEREVERLAAQRELWPGFDVLAIPLAVYTGQQTYLFRHPSTPEGFTAIADSKPPTSTFPGRHPAIVANSSAEIGGVMTATLFADEARASVSASELAATAIHEAFHVFQRSRHPTWSGNEGDLFLYPTDDARLLALRRLESAALRRALAATEDTSVACWTRLALSYRQDRFAKMGAAFAAYERLTELNEGLATYVQFCAQGKSTVEIPEAEFRATEFRNRIYAIGPAFAFLLDRLRPGWQVALEEDDTQFLDRMLLPMLGSEKRDKTSACALAPDDIAKIESTAASDVDAVLAARIARKKEFDARPGWRVVVTTADARPLRPNGFDPLHAEEIDGGFLHTRFLKLGNDAGELEMLDEPGADLEALTEGVGPHPLFNGVRRVVIAGLAKPEVTAEGGQVTLRVLGLSAHFGGASVNVNGTEVDVRVE